MACQGALLAKLPSYGAISTLVSDASDQGLGRQGSLGLETSLSTSPSRLEKICQDIRPPLHFYLHRGSSVPLPALLCQSPCYILPVPAFFPPTASPSSPSPWGNSSLLYCWPRDGSPSSQPGRFDPFSIIPAKQYTVRCHKYLPSTSCLCRPALN